MHDSMLYSSLGPLNRQNEYVETPIRVRRAGDGLAPTTLGRPAVSGAVIAAVAAAFLRKDRRVFAMGSGTIDGE